MPLTNFPGIIQFARSPEDETSIAPKTATSTLPPRIIENELAESKKDAPASAVTTSLPALIRSGSTSSGYGYGPTPSKPFSECKITEISESK